MAVTPIVATGDVLTATNFNNLPRGILGLTTSTSAFTTSATHTTYQDEGTTLSVTYAASRILRATFVTELYTPGGANPVGVKIVRGSTDLRVFQFATDELSTSFGAYRVCQVTFNGPSSSATETFKIQIASLSLNTSVTSFSNGATRQKILTVEDLGSQ
jgi:hypothetical protein